MHNLQGAFSDWSKARQTWGGESTNNLLLTDDSGSKLMH